MGANPANKHRLGRYGIIDSGFHGNLVHHGHHMLFCEGLGFVFGLSVVVGLGIIFANICKI